MNQAIYTDAVASPGTQPALSQNSIPIIDISRFTTGSEADRESIARQVDAACRAIGFFVVTGHDVPDSLVERVALVSRRFYDLPLEEKLKSTASRRGYFGMGKQAVAQSMGGKPTPPDTHEIFAMGRDWIDPADSYFQGPIADKVFSKNAWPDVPDFREAWSDYYVEMQRLAKIMCNIMELALGLPQGWFWQRADRNMATTSVINYPPQTGAPAEGQRRLGAHTDFGVFTFLKAEKKPGGLEVQAKNGEWETVPVIPGAYIVNVGDMLKRWTNDLWESSFHRVTNPPADAAVDSRRQSLVFFFHPNHDANVEPLSQPGMGEPKYPPIGAGELLVSRIDAMRKVKSS